MSVVGLSLLFGWITQTVLCLVAWKEAVFVPVENLLNAQCFLLAMQYSIPGVIFP